jgi:translocation and assembly module TamA
VALAVGAALSALSEGAAAQPRAAVEQAEPADASSSPASSSEPAAAAAPPSKAADLLSRIPFIGRFFRDADEPDPDNGRVAPHYALEVDAPEPVARQIREFTLLGRWRQRADYDPSQLPLFMRRADAEVRELLAAEGWFSPEIDVRRVGGGVRIAVVAGPRTRVASVGIELGGDIAAPEHAVLRERAVRDWLLADGAPFRSDDWDRAKRALLETLRNGGFLRARIDEAEALVVREDASAALSVSVESGPRLAFGELEVGGLQRYPVSVVEGLAPFHRGDAFDARRIVEFQSRLNGGGWFSTVNVRPDTQALERDQAATEVPVRVDVVERQSKRWTLGGGYDTDRGVSLLAAWENRNVGGLGVQTFNGIELDVQRQYVYSTWETPQDATGRRWQFGARGEHRDVQNDLVDAGSLFASLNRRRGDIETALSLQYQAERQNVVFGPSDEAVYHNRALVLGWTWTQRHLDSPIYPTRGYIVSGQLSGASAALGSNTSFVRAYALGYGILPLEDAQGETFGRVVLRGEIGSVFSDTRDGIPSANLFRTGGSRSIRGYGSQSLGVALGEATVGGRYLLTSSVEYQHLIDRDIAVAVFYDWGNAADSRSTLDPVAGYGVGLRWRTPVGPLNVDVAWGEAVRDWKLHVSIGVVF